MKKTFVYLIIMLLCTASYAQEGGKKDGKKEGIGIGEKIDDLQVFDREAFVDSLFAN